VAVDSAYDRQTISLADQESVLSDVNHEPGIEAEASPFDPRSRRSRRIAFDDPRSFFKCERRDLTWAAK
jgi:hypothetical protein